MDGIITTVQRMSVHDGPGLRSTVFMKGCNLRCRWCHNPETWSAAPQLQYISSECIGCRTCVQVCPKHVFSVHDNKLEIDRNLCGMCGVCGENCPGEALSVVGRRISVKEALAELLSDRIFYETSGGGVTVSGGEPLLQPEFTMELLAACRKEGIHTAVESNLTADWSVVSGIAKYSDLWMCDLKTADSVRHRYWTGRGNETVMDNLARLADAGAEIIVRTPVVPGVNDSEDDISRICRFLAGIGGNLRYELLGFHSLGFVKFDDLGMVNPMDGQTDLDGNILEKLRKLPEQYGIKSL